MFPELFVDYNPRSREVNKGFNDFMPGAALYSSRRLENVRIWSVYCA